MTRSRSARGAKTLPGSYYTDPELFAEEDERIFRRSWMLAGHVSELKGPGSYLLWSLEPDSLIVLRDAGGEVRAFHNVCRHRGSRLCGEPMGRFPGAIQCPYHAWTYALDGRLTGAPHMEELAGFARSDYPLQEACWRVWEGFLFVNLSPRPAAFEKALAPLQGRFREWRMDELRSAHRTIYEVEANWKLLFQNYSECYHCPAVHPVLNRLTPYRDSDNDLEEGPVLGGPMRMARQGGSMTMSGARCAAPLGEVGGTDLDLVYYYTVFPSMFLSLHPDYVLVHRCEPLGVSLTRVVCDWLFHPEAIAALDFDPSPAVELWDMTNRQDWDLCTISQQGISSSAYVPGPYSELESQLAAFDREYLRVMGRAGDPARQAVP